MPRYTNDQIEIMAAHIEAGTMRLNFVDVEFPVGPDHRENTPLVVAAMKLQRELDTLSRVPAAKRDGHPAQRRYLELAAGMSHLFTPYMKTRRQDD